MGKKEPSYRPGKRQTHFVLFPPDMRRPDALNVRSIKPARFVFCRRVWVNDTVRRLRTVRDYQHSHFGGVSLAPDGRELLLDYFDHDQGGTRLCFRYVLPLDAAPKRITGYAHESSRSVRQIGFGEIPRHVLREAEAWLVSNAEVARTQRRDALAVTLTQHLEHLRGHENDA